MISYLSRLGAWFLDRLSEKSTWAGLALYSATGSRHLSPEMLDWLGWIGPFISTGLICASTKKRDGEDKR